MSRSFTAQIEAFKKKTEKKIERVVQQSAQQWQSIVSKNAAIERAKPCLVPMVGNVLGDGSRGGELSLFAYKMGGAE